MRESPGGRRIEGDAENLEVAVPGVADHQLTFRPSPDGDLAEIDLGRYAQRPALREVVPFGIPGRVRERSVAPDQDLALTKVRRSAAIREVGLLEQVQEEEAIEVAVDQTRITRGIGRFRSQGQVVHEMSHGALCQVEGDEVEPTASGLLDQPVRE